MPNQLVVILTFVAALGSGLVAGVLFAFSGFVMRGLTACASFVLAFAARV